jgi:hypothetical protein
MGILIFYISSYSGIYIKTATGLLIPGKIHTPSMEEIYMPSRSRVKFKTSITSEFQWIVLYTFKPSTYRLHLLEKYSIFSTSAAIDQKTRSVHIYGHLNTYILLFDYRTLLVYTLQSSIFEWYWLMEYNGKANC